MRIVVIGSGIVGAGAAYYGSKAGAQITIIDAFHVGQATDASAGIICPWASRSENPARSDLSQRGALEFPSLVRELENLGESDIGYKPVGALLLYDGERARDEVLGLVETRRQSIPEIGQVRGVSGSDAVTLFPPLAAGQHGVYIEGAARADGRKLRDALVSGAKKLGAEIVSGQAHLKRDSLGRAIAEVNGDSIDGDAVILATGAWSAELLEEAGTSVPIVPQRGQIIHLDMRGTDISAWPVLLPALPYEMSYVVPFEGSRVVVGATRETGSGFDWRVTAGGEYSVLAETLQFSPGLADATHLETRVGFRPVSPDNSPLLGEIRGFSNAIIATGLGSYGLSTGPRLGRLAVMAAAGDSEGVDVGAFSPYRESLVAR